MPAWEDSSSWSQSESDRSVPKSWKLQLGQFRLDVHHHIHHEPDVWLVSCYPELFCLAKLASKDVDEAKCQAVAKLQVVLQEALADIARLD